MRERCHCGASAERRETPDPWEGRLDGYCDECAWARCDHDPTACPAKHRAAVADPSVVDALNTLCEARRRLWSHPSVYDGQLAEFDSALAQVERWHEALVQITDCNRDDFASAREIARCALGWPDS